MPKIKTPAKVQLPARPLFAWKDTPDAEPKEAAKARYYRDQDFMRSYIKESGVRL